MKRKEEKQMGVEAPVEVEDNAEEQETQSTDEQKEETMITLKVKGMSCQHCVMSITKALNQLEGIKDVQVDLEKGEVRFDNTKGVTNDRLKKTIADAGYEVIHA
jgi:copper chaperone